MRGLVRITVVKLKHMIVFAAVFALIVALAIAAYQWYDGGGVNRATSVGVNAIGANGMRAAADAAALPGFSRDIAALGAGGLRVEFELDETTYLSLPDPSTDIEIDIITSEFWLPADDDQSPRVLIYHTHTNEAYQQNPDDLYVQTDQWRTLDARYSVIRVGDELENQLKKRGIVVVHDLTDHEPPKLGTAYERSEAMLMGYIANGDTFDFYIDLHRDAFVASVDEQLTVDTPNGPGAKLMFLVGNGKNYANSAPEERPDYEANLALARRLTDDINTKVDGLAKRVFVKDGRYNQHVGEQCALIEVGNNKNTLEQALNSVPTLGTVIADYLIERANG